MIDYTDIKQLPEPQYEIEKMLYNYIKGKQYTMRKPVTRFEEYVKAYINGTKYSSTPQFRREKYICNLIGGKFKVEPPQDRIEKYLYYMMGNNIELPLPLVSRLERYFYYLAVVGGNNSYIYFNKTTTGDGVSNNKVFDIDDKIFYKPFEIEINYDVTNKEQKNYFALFCCRKTQSGGTPAIHIFSKNRKLNIDMSMNSMNKRLVDVLDVKDKGKINIKYNDGLIQLYYDDKLINNYDLTAYKLTSGLPKKCSVGMSLETNNYNMSNGTNGTVNVKIKKLKGENENTNTGYLNSLEVEKTGFICDNSSGVFKKSDTNCVVLLVNTKNKTKINLSLKQSPSANSFVRLCYFNNDSFISGVLQYYGTTISTKTFDIPVNTTTIRISTEKENLSKYYYELK